MRHSVRPQQRGACPAAEHLATSRSCLNFSASHLHHPTLYFLHRILNPLHTREPLVYEPEYFDPLRTSVCLGPYPTESTAPPSSTPLTALHVVHVRIHAALAAAYPVEYGAFSLVYEEPKPVPSCLPACVCLPGLPE